MRFELSLKKNSYETYGLIVLVFPLVNLLRRTRSVGGWLLKSRKTQKSLIIDLSRDYYETRDKWIVCLGLAGSPWLGAGLHSLY